MNELVEKCRLTDEEINKAFDGDWGEVFFDHKPTADEIFLIKLKLVANAATAKARKDFDELTIEMRREYEAKSTLAKNVARKQEGEGYLLNKDLYWKIKAMLVGVRNRQSKGITWGTTLDATLEELNKLEALKEGGKEAE